jgi:hypothetical protein
MPKRPARTSAGATRRNHGLQQAEQLRQDGDITTVAPLPSAPAYEWADYCNQAKGKAAGALIEWGRRIQEAHDAYRAQGQSWGRTWEDWCQENLGIGRGFANQLRLIGENLAVTNCQILPAATDQLTTLARIRRDAPEVFDAAVADGRINPAMDRAAARALLVETRPAPPAPKAPRTRSIRLTSELVELLEQRAQERGLTLVELLEDFALGR